MTASNRSPARAAPDLFENEVAALEKARAAYASPDAGAQDCRRSLGELIEHFEHLMRQTRRLIGHSDRAEREMQVLNQQLQTLARQFEYRATHDALTGVLNRGAVIDLSSKTLAEKSAVMVVLDIDNFKRVNDEYGHPVGDAVILDVVACLRRVVGEEGIIGRVGGEEFTVLLPDCRLDEAVKLAEAMRHVVATHHFPPPVDHSVTISLGLSANPRATAFDIAYTQADAALYAAKRAGRNRVEAARPEL